METHSVTKENAEKIFESGFIKSMSRQLVHLSKDIETASNVGIRHGELEILVIDCERASSDGAVFYISDNKVI